MGRLYLTILLVIACFYIASADDFQAVHENYIAGIGNYTHLDPVFDSDGNYAGVIASDCPGYKLDIYDSLGFLINSIELDNQPLKTINRYSQNNDTLQIYALLNNALFWTPYTPYIVKLISLYGDSISCDTVAPTCFSAEWVGYYVLYVDNVAGNIKFVYDDYGKQASLVFQTRIQYSEPVTTQGTFFELVLTYIKYDLDLKNIMYSRWCLDYYPFALPEDQDSAFAVISDHYVARQDEPENSWTRRGTGFAIIKFDGQVLAEKGTKDGHSYSLHVKDFISASPGVEIIYHGYASDLLGIHNGKIAHMACYKIADDSVIEVWYLPDFALEPYKYSHSNNVMAGMQKGKKVLFLNCSDGTLVDSCTLDHGLYFKHFHESSLFSYPVLFGCWYDTLFIYQFDSSTEIEDTSSHILLPANFHLTQNHPNPFNASTEFEYSLPERSEVKISVYNILGRKVLTLVDENKSAGNYTVRWAGVDKNGKPIAGGTYFYRMVAGQYTETKKMIFLK